MGVFATRSPFRPNPIGLSCVRLVKICDTEKEGSVLLVEGVDMMDGTPIYDIKPYLPHIDAHQTASGGFALAVEKEQLDVHFPDELLQKVDAADRSDLFELLAQDPRDRYIHDPKRIWGLAFRSYNIRFTVTENKLNVCEVTKRM